MTAHQEISNVPLVSVVIPTHNRKIAVTRCVESILRSNHPRVEVIVVDDASTDGTLDNLTTLFPNILLVRFEQERMVSASRNAGLKRARGQLVFFVDDDNVVDPNTIAELVKGITANPTAGIAGPIMYYLREPGNVWCSGVNRSLLTSITKFSTEKPNGSEDCYPTDDVPNAFMIRRRVFDEVGNFDQIEFAQHLAEGDFAVRAARKGFKAIMVPKAAIWHDVPTRKWPYRGARSLHMSSSRRAYEVARNRIWFMRKYAGPWRFVLFTLGFLPPIALSHIVIILADNDLGDRRGNCAESYARGLIDGFSMIMPAGAGKATSN